MALFGGLKQNFWITTELPCNGLASHQAGSINAASHFMLQKLELSCGTNEPPVLAYVSLSSFLSFPSHKEGLVLRLGLFPCLLDLLLLEAYWLITALIWLSAQPRISTERE